ncbi:hypothetical protein DITRI_Ditri16bG0111000 [Diplodiscus trichospermus]
MKEMEDMNDSMLMKIIWRIWSQPESLCSMVIQRKYGVNVKTIPISLQGTNGSQTWKAICSVWEEFRKGLKWSVGYELLNSGNWNIEDKSWKIIWRWKGPQRIRSFLWLAVQDRLLTKTELCRRHMANDETCGWCHEGKETGLHVLRDCNVARQVWLNLVSMGSREYFFSMGYKDWLLKILVNEDGMQSEIDWPTLFGVGVWRIWFWRNQALYDRNSRPIHSKGEDIRCRVREILKIDEAITQSRGKQNIQEIRVRWWPPIWPRAKLNTDGAVNNATGICDVKEAELWGLYKGLIMAWEEGIRKLDVEIDNEVIWKALSDKGSNQCVLSSLGHDVKELFSREWEVELKQVCREANSVADKLAKQATSWPLGLHILHDPPDDIIQLINKDKQGHMVSRMITS